MKIFSKEDFLKDGVDFLVFDDNFEFDNSNKIIFGFNGIGKTSIYTYLRKTKFADCEFLDYNDKPKFTGAGKKLTIAPDVSELNYLIAELENIKKKISLKECFKIYNIKTKADVNKLNNNEFSNIYNSKKIFEMPFIEKTKYQEVIELFSTHELPLLIGKMEEIRKIDIVSKEIYDYSEKYLLDVFNKLEGHYDEYTNKCPICGSENIDLYNIIKSKKNELLELSKNLFCNFNRVISLPVDEQESILNKIVNVSRKITISEIVAICLSNGNYDEYEEIFKDSNKINAIEDRILELSSKRDEFYRSMSENKKFTKTQFEQIYVDSKIVFDDTNKEIKIELPRDFKTYSTGELNELCLVIKLLSFTGSSKTTLIIDDPLSSYDYVNQYRIIFRIVKVLKDKNVIIFTHNIDTINIINTQHNGLFDYYYIEKLGKKLILEQIHSKGIINSILSLDTLKSMNKYIELLVYRENTDESAMFSGHQIFHYNSSFTFNSLKDKELHFNGLTNDYLVELIENNNIIYQHSFELNTITKILYICGLRVWIEKKIRDFILTLPEPQRTTYSKKFISKNTTVERLNIVQHMDEFTCMYPNYMRERFMIKKVMLNQDSHYKSQIIPFNFAMNISLDDLKREIMEVKMIFEISKGVEDGQE